MSDVALDVNEVHFLTPEDAVAGANDTGAEQPPPMGAPMPVGSSADVTIQQGSAAMVLPPCPDGQYQVPGEANCRFCAAYVANCAQCE